ncbi:MAG: hypothetical protein SFT91_04545 [Rickettsiaceae bacterium]|nr:hypothetical protein [Rickettsiaceae bacterium]
MGGKDNKGTTFQKLKAMEKEEEAELMRPKDKVDMGNIGSVYANQQYVSIFNPMTTSRQSIKNALQDIIPSPKEAALGAPGGRPFSQVHGKSANASGSTSHATSGSSSPKSNSR